MTFVVFLHVVAAIFIIGPLATVGMMVPRALRSGADALPVLRWLSRTTRAYALAALLVGGLGLIIVRGDYSWSEAWLSISAGLYVVALVLVLAVLDPYIRKAVRRLEAGESPPEPGTYVAASGVVGLLWLVVVALMVFQPGHHGG